MWRSWWGCVRAWWALYAAGGDGDGGGGGGGGGVGGGGVMIGDD